MLGSMLIVLVDVFGKRNRAFFHKHDVLAILGLR